ncbi:glutamate--tRNA ligase [Candidatus Woesearchaeota archaeon]|nr:glutamate--tRNA ligase [Candidatus Woesearchaeota archaeon]
MGMDKKIDSLIEAFALENALSHKGKAAPGGVVGKVIAADPSVKGEMNELTRRVIAVIKEVNNLSFDEQRILLEERHPEMLNKPKKEKSDELKDLDNVDPQKGVVMRFSPSPSGPMHIGHALTGGLTSLYVEKYGGRFILRIEDTNSDNIDPYAYDQLPKDADWLFGNVSKVWVQSDRMGVYYDYMDKFLEKEAVYVCTCSQEEFKKHSLAKKDCPCRALMPAVQKARWKKMLDKDGFKAGEAVVRFKSSMQDKNPAMRDFPLMRINESEHPRQGRKYRAWPLMNFAVAVDDIEAGMTHIIRAKDHADNAKRQAMMYKALELSFSPQVYFLGRYNFDGLELSCSKTRARIEAGEFSGWSDIRLPFIEALKRRGYQPGAFKKYTRQVGLSLTDKSVKAEEFYKGLNALNKEILDPVSKRFFLIRNPQKIKVENAPAKEVELDLHPDNEKGGRNFRTGNEFYIEEADFKALKKDGLYRLMDCLNLYSKDGKFMFDSFEYEKYKAHGNRIIHWLPADKESFELLLKVEVLMPDNMTVECLGEPGLDSVNVGDVIQAERFGFMRLDSKEKGVLRFWFAHN